MQHRATGRLTRSARGDCGSCEHDGCNRARSMPRSRRWVGFPGTFPLLPFSAFGLVVLAWGPFVERRPFAAIGLGESTARGYLREVTLLVS
jgi:hypothetical protein